MHPSPSWHLTKLGAAFARGPVMLIAIGLAAACVGSAPAVPRVTASPPALMTPADLQAVPVGAPDARIAYGADSSQFAELRVPRGRGPHPVVVLIHGGCFKANYATLRDLTEMAEVLRDGGFATWNVEYRRLGQPGGGWPGTYLDVARAVDHLTTIADARALDLDRVVVVGHSAGGHLAMWVAGRARVPGSSDIHAPSALRLRGVIDLAGPVDLTANIAGYEGLCRDRVITGLLGGMPEDVPDRYAQASPIRLLPFGIPQVLIIGDHEDFVPRPLVEAYVSAAIRAGDPARLTVLSDAGHFDIASPRARTWPTVVASIRSLLDGRLP